VKTFLGKGGVARKAKKFVKTNFEAKRANDDALALFSKTLSVKYFCEQQK